MSTQTYVITGTNSYSLHILDEIGGAALCPSTAAVTPTEAKVNHPKAKVCGKCTAIFAEKMEELAETAEAEAAHEVAEAEQVEDFDEVEVEVEAAPVADLADEQAEVDAIAEELAEEPQAEPVEDAEAEGEPVERKPADEKKIAKVKRQIKAALNLAETPGTPQVEVAAALAKAAQLMAAFQISEGELGEDVPVALRPEIVSFDVEVTDKDRIGARRRSVVHSIASAMGGATVWFNEHRSFRVQVWISSTAAPVAQAMIQLALLRGEETMQALAKDFLAQPNLTAKQRDTGAQRIRRSALTGFAAGVAHAITEARLTAVEDKMEVTSERPQVEHAHSLPVLKAESDRARDAIDGKYTKLRKGQGAKGEMDWDSFMTGYNEGTKLTEQEIETGKPQGELAA